MAIYVDNFNAKYGRMIMCHMFADTTEELLGMCSAIGVNTKWIQHAGTANEHFDIALTKKKEALARGAVEVNFREYAAMINNRIKTGRLKEPVKVPCNNCQGCGCTTCGGSGYFQL